MSAEAPPSAGVNAQPTTTLADPDCFLRMRLSAIDFVQSYDHSPFDNRRSPFSKGPLRSVPTIRIFGATDKGQRVVAHVHGVLPYVYVKYEGALDPESGTHPSEASATP
jgi:DNA polymerase zeta